MTPPITVKSASNGRAGVVPAELAAEVEHLLGRALDQWGEVKLPRCPKCSASGCAVWSKLVDQWRCTGCEMSGATSDLLRRLKRQAGGSSVTPMPIREGISSVLSVDEAWPAPDSIAAPPPAPPLPLASLPKEIADVATDVAERLHAPIDFVAWPLIVSSAGLIGRGAGLRPLKYDDWTERPALWCSLIGLPSTMKSPAIDNGTRPLHRQSEANRRQFECDMEDWGAACAAARAADPKSPSLPVKPIERRCWAGDVTVERLAALLTTEVSRGLTVVRDELAGLILDMDRYHQRGGDRQFYLQSYTGGPYTVDRQSRDGLFVADLLLNIIGGIQPEMARGIFGGGVEDGFAARFLSIWPDLAPEWQPVDRWPNIAARDAVDAVNAKLADTDWAVALDHDEYKPTPFCRLDPLAQEAFNAWHQSTMVALRAGAYRGRLEGRVGKYPGVAARLMLIFHLNEWAAGRQANPRIVSWQTVGSVLNLMDHYLLPMDERVYAAYAVPAEAEGGRRIAGWLMSQHPMPLRFTARDVLRHDWAGLQDAASVHAALEWLTTRRWLREAETDKRPGRPSSAYTVNPRLEAPHA